MYPVGGEGKTRWTFRADGSSGQATPVRLLNVAATADLDRHNQARADRPLNLNVSVSGASSSLRNLQAWVTADGGATWTEVTVLPAGPGKYGFTAPRTPLVADSFLGFRITAEDAAGTAPRGLYESCRRQDAPAPR
ncbi:hypothetical protein [Micromonospora sp. NPDC006431]|uniref:hypothetical protein n=1 Tax=Micromonospora sp. NPDC006431 TaxID=3364235 RepID=UPI0036B469A0